MWYVIQTRARHEIAVVEKCRRDVLVSGENVFVMMAEKMTKVHGEWKLVQDVAFQKYIFAETEDTDDFRIRLRKVSEMTRMLGVGDEIVPIRREEEDLLRDLGGEEHLIRFSLGFVKGDRLVITEGSMKGYEGMVTWIDRHQREAGLEVDLLGQTVNVRMGCEILKKLPD